MKLRSSAYKPFDILENRTKVLYKICNTKIERTEKLTISSMLTHIEKIHKFPKETLNKMSWKIFSEENENMLSKRKSNHLF